MEPIMKTTLRKAKLDFESEEQKAKETGKTGTLGYYGAEDKLTRMIQLARAQGYSARQIRAAQNED